MNAHKFVAEHGIEKAKRVLDKYKDCYMPSVFKYWSEKVSDFVLAPKYASCKVSELKQVVESVEIIQRSGGFESVKAAITNYRASGDMVTFSSLEKRLADYELVESLTGGDHV